jgi:hypothetical protein
MISLDFKIGPSPVPAAMDHLAPIVLGDLLMPETEPNDGHVQVVDFPGVVLILSMGGKSRASRYDDPFVRLEGLDGIFWLPDLSTDSKAANFGCDEMGVLPSKIDDGDGVV